jgi:hypothetical protein
MRPKFMRVSSIVIVTLIALINAALMAALNRPYGGAVAWDGMLRGVAFSPYARGQSPVQKKYPGASPVRRASAWGRLWRRWHCR